MSSRRQLCGSSLAERRNPLRQWRKEQKSLWGADKNFRETLSITLLFCCEIQSDIIYEEDETKGMWWNLPIGILRGGWEWRPEISGDTRQHGWFVSYKSHWVQEWKRQMLWFILSQAIDRQMQLKDNLAKELRVWVGINGEVISQYDRLFIAEDSELWQNGK